MTELIVDTANGTPEEHRVRQALLDLLDRYDVARWRVTDHVVIDETAIPHSHPVLTLSTRVLGRSLTGLLSTYLHEQLHWYLGARYDATVAAIDEVRELFPEVPPQDRGGAHDDDSTYLHLVLNWLELESLRLAVDANDADTFVAAVVDGPGYGWIYRQVVDLHSEIGGIVRAHGLDEILPSST